jgi:phosphoserine phosphatase
LSNTRIHLIRHGQTDWNRDKRIQGRSESRLTDEGKQQAATLRQGLDCVPIAKVFCSSSVRTRETAQILFADREIPTEYCDDLREIFLGPWEGALWAQMMLMFPDKTQAFWERPHEFALDGGETFHQVQERGVSRFLEILKQSEQQEVAIVSHGVLIKSILCYLEQRPLARLWEPPHMHNCAHSIVEVPERQAPRIIQYANVLLAELQNDSMN